MTSGDDPSSRNIDEDRPRTVHFVSLGCPKNRVDTERMVGLADASRFRVVADEREAEVIVINTCGFIEAAKRESIEVILEMAAQKETGRCRSLIVAGCLSQRYPDQLAAELPEVDHFLGTADLGRLKKILDHQQAQARLAVGRPEGLEEALYQRRLGTSPHSAYLKIGEGCDRPCAFCVIPLMRGRQRSRTIASLLQEAQALADAGTRELILVAQDTTAYGRDLSPAVDLCRLLEALDGIDALRWLRVHYAYPSMVDPRLCQTIARLPRVLPYLDLPLQHIDDALLRRMRRGYGRRQIEAALSNLRAAIPDITIRTTFLCGHPGETAGAHRSLLEFIDSAELDNVGAFAFSAEEGTHAATQADAVAADIAEARAAEVIDRQREVSRRRLARLRGETVKVLVDGPSPESEFLLVGRTAGQSPEIDGTVTLTDGAATPGTIVSARVTDSGDYDLVATLDLERHHP